MEVDDDVLGSMVVLLANECEVEVVSSASTIPSWSALLAAAVISVVLVSIPSFSCLTAILVSTTSVMESSAVKCPNMQKSFVSVI